MNKPPATVIASKRFCDSVLCPEVVVVLYPIFVRAPIREGCQCNLVIQLVRQYARCGALIAHTHEVQLSVSFSLTHESIVITVSCLVSR